MVNNNIIVILSFILYLGNVENANILAIFPVPVKSHYVMSKTILQDLAFKGHNVDLYTSFPEEEKIPRIVHHQIPNIEPYNISMSIAEIRATTLPASIPVMFEEPDGGIDICEKSFRSEIMKKLRDEKKSYDLIFLEIFLSDCFFGFAHILKTPIVALTSSVDLPWGSHRIGNPDNPAYLPTYFAEFDGNMSLYERLVNTLTLIYAKYQHSSYNRYEEELAKKFFGKELPPLNDIVSNTSLLLVNSHFSVNQARPTVPNFIEIAGLHIKDPKPLTEELSNFIGDSKFIYFSFGSIVNSESIDLEQLQYICDTFKKLKYKILWKADRKQLPKELNVPENIYTSKWMPQLDILCHPNLLFFITHSGLMSTQEALYCGAPMISVPIFADQFLNAKNIENKGIGRILEIETASKEDIYEIMIEMAENMKYKENAMKLSNQFKDRPLKPRKEAIYWIEYVLKYNGAPQLRSRAMRLTWYEYYLLDVGILIITSVVVLLFVIYKIFNYIFIVLWNKKHIISKKKQ